MNPTTSSKRGASRSGRSASSAQRGRTGGSSARTRSPAGRAPSSSPRKSRTAVARPRASARSGGGARRNTSRATPHRQQQAHPLVPLAIVGVVLAVCWSMYDPLKVQYQASRQYHGLEREYDQLSARNHTLRTEIADLKKPEGIERIAREDLGLTLPGENVYIVMPSVAATGQPPAPTTRTKAAATDEPLTVLLDAVFGVGR